MSVLFIALVLAFVGYVALRMLGPKPQGLVGPAISAAELDELEEWHRSTERPVAVISVGSRPAMNSQQSQLGGQPWVGSDFVWPEDELSRPLLFLAQINLSELPPLPGFPDSGMMLFFVGRDPSFGVGRYADPVGDTRVIFYPHAVAMTGSPAALPYPVGPKPFAPFLDTEVMGTGRSIEFTTSTMRAPLADWRLWERSDTFNGRIGQEAFEHRFAELSTGAPTHFVGGYAQFSQHDPRVPVSDWRVYDTPVLKLGSDDMLAFGVDGKANFIVSQESLHSQSFNRYLFAWDSAGVND